MTLQSCRRLIFVVGVTACMLVRAAHVWSGHEAGIYPSYYPQEIKIEVVPREAALPLISKGTVHAYVGADAVASTTEPDVSYAESLGGYIVAQISGETGQPCEPAGTVSAIPLPNNAIRHPYPITPFHPDYPHHFDIISRAARQPAATIGDGKPPAVTLRGVPLTELLQAGRWQLNGHGHAPWMRSGWYHAHLLLAGALTDDVLRRQADAILNKLQSEFQAAETDRIQLERSLVRILTSQCRLAVLGYRVLREPYATEYYAGIENVAHDSLAGLNSAIFVRTVKLKDFPWNGWLTLGVEAPAAAAWNPIAGFSDPTGRLIWQTVSDTAFIALPQGLGWMGNRISSAETTPRRSRR